ncbi:MAG TPA: hypothetical protein VKQ30_04025 [Ktedonobacterales bacterium]|nr:hypothetical protein [Ktedonobacterales bacterium]
MRDNANDATGSWGDVIRWGLIAGLVGGIVMAMFMMIVTALAGMGFLAPVYAIAATFHPSWAMTRGFDLAPLVVGLMLHMMNSAVFGLIFTLLARWLLPRARSLPASAVAGMVWGLLLLAVNQAIVLPLVDTPMATATSGIFGWWLIGHLMYGGVLGMIAGATLGRPASAPGRLAHAGRA